MCLRYRHHSRSNSWNIGRAYVITWRDRKSSLLTSYNIFISTPLPKTWHMKPQESHLLTRWVDSFQSDPTAQIVNRVGSAHSRATYLLTASVHFLAWKAMNFKVIAGNCKVERVTKRRAPRNLWSPKGSSCINFIFYWKLILLPIPWNVSGKVKH